MNKKIVGAEALLLLTSAIWGFSFVAQRVGMETLGPFVFNGIRFALGSISLLSLIYFNKIKNRSKVFVLKKESISGGLILGLILFVGASLQQVGMIYTTAGNAGFITSLYVILVPVFGIFFGHKITLQLTLGALLAISGLYFLSITYSFTIAKGDFLVLISAFFWAIHVLAISHFAPKANVFVLSFLQFAVCSVLSLLTAIIFEEFNFQNIVSAWIPILYGGIMAVGIAFTLQVYAQKSAPPSHAAIILSLESLFAVIGGWMILNEELNSRKAVGCLLMLSGIIVSQIKIKKMG